MSSLISRRDFSHSTVLAVPALLPAQTTGTKVNLGWVGLGNRGGRHIKTMMKVAKDTALISAVCDTFSPRMAKGKDVVASQQGSVPKAYRDYYNMLGDASIDAVVIMTPEHLHRDMAIAALEAGKHVYCEKPLSHTIEEGHEILAAVTKSGKKFQVGTQRRSSLLYQKAKEIYESGVLGEVVYARAFWFRNSPTTFPAWRYKIPEDSVPQNTDYEKFLGAAPDRGFNKKRYFQWRLYWDYSGGISTDLLVHQTDAIHMITGRTHCKSVMCNGGIHYWREDDREVPDTVTAGFEYPGNFHINYSAAFSNAHFRYGEQLLGSEGTMEIIGLRDLYVYPERYRNAPEEVSSRPEIHIRGRKDLGQGNPTGDHLKNFIDAIRDNVPLNCNAQTGHEAAVTGHLATMSYREEKKVFWDHDNQRYHLG